MSQRAARRLIAFVSEEPEPWEREGLARSLAQALDDEGDAELPTSPEDKALLEEISQNPDDALEVMTAADHQRLLGIVARCWDVVAPPKKHIEITDIGHDGEEVRVLCHCRMCFYFSTHAPSIILDLGVIPHSVVEVDSPPKIPKGIYFVSSRGVLMPVRDGVVLFDEPLSLEVA